MRRDAGSEGGGDKQEADLVTHQSSTPQRVFPAEASSPGENDHLSFAGLLSPADKIAIAYLAIIAALIVTSNRRIEYWPHLIAGHALAIVVIVLIAKLGRLALLSLSQKFTDSPIPRFSDSPIIRFAALIRGWYVLVLIPVTYKELSYLIPLVHPKDYDAEMAAIDRWLLGVDPTIWLERITWPPLTDVLQISYSTYYFLPVILGAVLWRKGWFDKFHFFVFILVLGFYLSYLGYVSVPVMGPRFLPSIKNAQSFALSGSLFGGELFRAIRETLDRAEGITRDCFPSGHTELTLLVLYYARLFHRKTFWIMLPFGAALIFSTVYLRYHYVIDVIAGALLALIVILTANWLYRALGGLSQVPARTSPTPGT